MIPRDMRTARKIRAAGVSIEYPSEAPGALEAIHLH